jgi:predicted HAD superfamily phosphohydrolase
MTKKQVNSGFKNKENELIVKMESTQSKEEAVTLYKEQLIQQIDELFQKKIQYDITQLREKIQSVQTGIETK